MVQRLRKADFRECLQQFPGDQRYFELPVLEAEKATLKQMKDDEKDLKQQRSVLLLFSSFGPFGPFGPFSLSPV